MRFDMVYLKDIKDIVYTEDNDKIEVFGKELGLDENQIKELLNVKTLALMSRKLNKFDIITVTDPPTVGHEYSNIDCLPKLIPMLYIKYRSKIIKESIVFISKLVKKNYVTRYKSIGYLDNTRLIYTMRKYDDTTALSMISNFNLDYFEIGGLIENTFKEFSLTEEGLIREFEGILFTNDNIEIVLKRIKKNREESDLIVKQ